MHIWLKSSERHKVETRVMKKIIDENHPLVTDDPPLAECFWPLTIEKSYRHFCGNYRKKLFFKKINVIVRQIYQYIK